MWEMFIIVAAAFISVSVGLWLVIRNLYESLAAGTPPPISSAQMLEVNQLVDALKNEGNCI